MPSSEDPAKLRGLVNSFEKEFQSDVSKIRRKLEVGATLDSEDLGKFLGHAAKLITAYRGYTESLEKRLKAK